MTNNLCNTEVSLNNRSPFIPQPGVLVLGQERATALSSGTGTVGSSESHSPISETQAKNTWSASTREPAGLTPSSHMPTTKPLLGFWSPRLLDSWKQKIRSQDNKIPGTQKPTRSS